MFIAMRISLVFLLPIHEIPQQQNSQGLNMSTNQTLFLIMSLTGCSNFCYNSFQISQTPLHNIINSSSENRIRIFYALLKNGASPNEIGNDGSSILQCVIRQKIYPAINALVEHHKINSNAQAQNITKNTALHEAIMHHDTSSTVILLKRCGANPNIKNYAGLTPLHLIMMLGINPQTQLELTQYLIEFRANPTIQDNQGRTAINIAMQHQLSQEIIDCLHNNLYQTTPPQEPAHEKTDNLFNRLKPPSKL